MSLSRIIFNKTTFILVKSRFFIKNRDYRLWGKELLCCGQSRPGRTVFCTKVLIIKSSSCRRAWCFNLGPYWICSDLEGREKLLASLDQKYSSKCEELVKKAKLKVLLYFGQWFRTEYFMIVVRCCRLTHHLYWQTYRAKRFRMC